MLMNTSKLLRPFPRIFITLLISMVCMMSCSKQKTSPVYDVIVVGGGPAGIGAALASAKAGAHTLLIERDSLIGGTTVQAKVTDMGLFHAWTKQIIDGPVWELVTRAVAEAGGSMPDFSQQKHDKWMESCVKVNPEVYARVAKEMLQEAGVELMMNVEVTSINRTIPSTHRATSRSGNRVSANGNSH